MIVTIHQPEHMPWLGFFNKIRKAERYVILDSVPFRKNYVQNRNRIIGSNGAQWLSVPVYIDNHLTSTIKDMRIAKEKQPRWKDKYLRTLQLSYGKHKYFDEIYPVVKGIFGECGDSICRLNIAIIKAFAKNLGLSLEFILSSGLDITGNKSDLILNICKATNADIYIAGPSGRDYLDLDSFMKADIDVKYNDFVHPVYPQRKQKEFISHMSSLDLLMNCGFEKSLAIIMEGNEGLSEI